MKRREVFGRLGGLTAAAASLLRIKTAPRTHDTGKIAFSAGIRPGGVISVSTSTVNHFCVRCGGLVYGYGSRGNPVCMCWRAQ